MASKIRTFEKHCIPKYSILAFHDRSVETTQIAVLVYQTQRRITHGEVVDTPKRYIAYLVKASTSIQTYDAWLCGGAIVSPLFIITSAACVEDVKHTYAIAGYNKYVPARDIYTNDCTKAAKKKIVFTCTPKLYELKYDKTEVWSNVDIAAARVETPYDFSAAVIPSCSWVPDMIEINFDPKYQDAGTDSMVLGWGHTEWWRQIDDTTDYNQEFLHYAPTLIEHKSVCKKDYSNNPALLPIIDNYMICTKETGNLNANGRLIKHKRPTADGCPPDDKDCSTRSNKKSKSAPLRYGMHGNNNNWRRNANENETGQYQINRRTAGGAGICQNDHGGPLVTWVGTTEVLIGVASVFLVSADHMKCVGPYLYTSTQCNGAFISCVLNIFDEKDNKTMGKALRTVKTEDDIRREDILERYEQRSEYSRRMCEMPAKDRGFDIIKRRISWLSHPDGPAANELNQDLIPRPQIPLANLRQNGDDDY